MERTVVADRALVRRFPEIVERLPHVCLCELPTPATRAQKLELEARIGPLYVKRDDRSAKPYGGNKPRKLEWLLAHAQARGAKRVLTFGGLGTNHGLATALYAAQLGLSCDLVLVDQPVDDHVRLRLRQLQGTGAKLRYGKNFAGAALAAVGRVARHPRTVVVPTGGSSPLGVLGFVDAGLELAEQVHRRELPEPARLYVAVGTGGTLAGLAAGLSLGGLRTQLVGVLVTDILPPSPRKIDRLARRALRTLARAGAQVGWRDLPLEFEIEAGHLGDGYGHGTERGKRACEVAERLEGLHLDPTYTGKTLGALLVRERDRSEPVVYWNTYSAREPELPLADWPDLPESLHRFFRERA